MSDTDTRIEEAYNHMKASTEHNYQRVHYEIPGGSHDWIEGYTAEAKVSGEPALKVVSETQSWTIPWHRVITARAGGLNE